MEKLIIIIVVVVENEEEKKDYLLLLSPAHACMDTWRGCSCPLASKQANPSVCPSVRLSDPIILPQARTAIISDGDDQQVPR